MRPPVTWNARNGSAAHWTWCADGPESRGVARAGRLRGARGSTATRYTKSLPHPGSSRTRSGPSRPMSLLHYENGPLARGRGNPKSDSEPSVGARQTQTRIGTLIRAGVSLPPSGARYSGHPPARPRARAAGPSAPARHRGPLPPRPCHHATLTPAPPLPPTARRAPPPHAAPGARGSAAPPPAR